jgi:two-component system, OmpR family, catabolic regulation response regulator CreB
MHVLLLEDDPAVAETVVYALQREGMQVTHCLLVRDAREQITKRSFDVLIFDIGLPDGNGLALCQELRHSSRSETMPILILSSRSDEIDRVLGLELGADDYLPKPFGLRELVARVKALQRRHRGANLQAAHAKVAAFVHDATAQRIALHNHWLDLTRLEYKLLACLLARCGHICSRDDLLQAVWGKDVESNDRTVDTHIKTLRNKLRGVDTHTDWISTHRGMGYRLETTPT